MKIRTASFVTALFVNCVSSFAYSSPFGMVSVENTGSGYSVSVPGEKIIRISLPFPAGQTAESAHAFVAKLARPVSLNEIQVTAPEGCHYCIEADSLLRMGFSFVSDENARINVEAELSGRSFDDIAAENDAEWNFLTNKIAVSGGDAISFEDNLKQSLSLWGLTSDVNGEYIAVDGSVRRVPAGRSTYASFAPLDYLSPDMQLLALLAPSVASDLVMSYILMEKKGAALLFPEAYFFGADQYNPRACQKPILVQLDEEGRAYGFKEALEDAAFLSYATIACDEVFGLEGPMGRIEKYEGELRLPVPQFSDAKGSAYVFLALGLYPDNPAEGGFRVLRPEFKKSLIDMGSYKLEIKRRGCKLFVNGNRVRDWVSLNELVPKDDRAPLNGDNRALWVDTNMGRGGHGWWASNTFSGVTWPFGMVQMTASPFKYLRNCGFVVNQLNGTGGPNMGNFPMLPLKGTLDFSPERMMNLSVPISREQGHPGYYSAFVQGDTKTEFTTTERSGMARIKYDSTAGDKATVIIGTGVSSVPPAEGRQMLSYGHVTGPRTCEGWAVGTSFCGIPTEYKVYFAAEFNRDAFETGVWEKDKLTKGGDCASNTDSGLYFSFDISEMKELGYKVAISYVSIENAKLNLASENPSWNFDELVSNCEREWNKYLGLIDVESRNTLRTRQMYLHIYHSFMHPNVYSDVNGEYIGSDWQVHHTEGKQYELFSNWDTYRTQIQLLSMLVPDIASEIVRSHLDFAHQAGDAFPRWSMVNVETGIMQGDPTSALISNAWAFGARDFDAEQALVIMRRGAEIPGLMCQNFEVRPELQKIFTEGFCKPSLLLEYMSADFAIGQFALSAFGDKALCDEYTSRAQSWKNLYNPENGWLQNRNQDGSWKEFDYGWGDYVEASYQAYYWMVPFNVKALIDLIGEEKAEARLDEHLSRLDANIFQDWFAIGNEPSFQIPWNYNWLGKPWKSAKTVNRILNESFSYSEGGLPGNDDVGAMAAWWIFASSGMYPYIPGMAGFTLNTPIFKKVTMHLPGGNLVIKGGDEKKIYTNSLRLDGEELNQSWIEWDKLKNGACLEYKTSSKSGSSWAVDYCPPSFDAPVPELISF